MVSFFLRYVVSHYMIIIIKKKSTSMRKTGPPQHCIEKKLLVCMPRNTPKADCPGHPTECSGHMPAATYILLKATQAVTRIPQDHSRREVLFNPSLFKFTPTGSRTQDLGCLSSANQSGSRPVYYMIMIIVNKGIIYFWEKTSQIYVLLTRLDH